MLLNFIFLGNFFYKLCILQIYTSSKAFPFLTFSLISNALLHRGSASLYLPLFPYRTAKLFKVAATYKTGLCHTFERISQQTKA